MQNDDFNKEWESLGQELDQEMANLPTKELPEKHQDIYQKRLINNNLVELTLTLSQIPMIILFIMLFDDKGYLPFWINGLLVFATAVSVYPSIRIYQGIHFADPSLPTVAYLKLLAKRMHQYKIIQVAAAFFLCLLISEIGFLFSRGITTTIDGETYQAIVNFPASVQPKFIWVITGLSLLFSIFAAASAYAMYSIFYKRRRKETLERLQQFE